MKRMTVNEVKQLNEEVLKSTGELVEANSKWAEQIKVELADAEGMELDDVEITSDGSSRCTITGSGSSSGATEWEIYKNEKDAREQAIQMNIDSLEGGVTLDELMEFGNGANKGWIKNFMYVSPSDIRMISNEEADNYVDGIKEEDDGERVCDEAGNGSKYADIKEKMEDSSDDKQTQKLQKELDKLIEKSASKVHDEYSKDLKERLTDDPVDWAMNDLGYESIEDVKWLNVDWEKASEYTIEQDGIAYALDSYNGEGVELKSGFAYGVN